MAKVWFDNFTRANGNLDGDTLSGGGATWDSPSGLWTVTSNQGVMTGLIGEAIPTALVEPESDTDNVFAQAPYVLALGTGPYISFGLQICMAADLSSGYLASIETGGLLNLFELSTFTLVDQAVGQPASGLMRVERNGVTGELTVWINGAIVIGPTVDTSQTYGAGFRYSAISAYADAADGSESVTLSYFTGGDVVGKGLLLSSARNRTVV